MIEQVRDLGKVIPTFGGAHNRFAEYEFLTYVYDEDTLAAYLSKTCVPKGVEITNRDYWQPMNVSGYVADNIIILSDKDEAGNLKSYTLEEAVKSIAQVSRKQGCLLSFFNANPYPHWEIWQYDNVNVYEWEELKYWRSVYYVWNKFVGWFNTPTELKEQRVWPINGKYAIIGSPLREATIYKGVDNEWIDLHISPYQYIVDDIINNDGIELTATQRQKFRDLIDTISREEFEDFQEDTADKFNKVNRLILAVIESVDNILCNFPDLVVAALKKNRVKKVIMQLITNPEEGLNLEGYVRRVSYDKRNKVIKFLDDAGNTVAKISTVDFIKDGMVNKVEVKNGNLVITFNTDAGQEDILIPITEFFDASKYYTKTEINALLDEYVKGPASSTNENIAVFNGADGKKIKDGGKSIEDLCPNNPDAWWQDEHRPRPYTNWKVRFLIDKAPLLDKWALVAYFQPPYFDNLDGVEDYQMQDRDSVDNPKHADPKVYRVYDEITQEWVSLSSQSQGNNDPLLLRDANDNLVRDVYGKPVIDLAKAYPVYSYGFFNVMRIHRMNFIRVNFDYSIPRSAWWIRNDDKEIHFVSGSSTLAFDETTGLWTDNKNFYSPSGAHYFTSNNNAAGKNIMNPDDKTGYNPQTETWDEQGLLEFNKLNLWFDDPKAKKYLDIYIDGRKCDMTAAGTNNPDNVKLARGFLDGKDHVVEIKDRTDIYVVQYNANGVTIDDNSTDLFLQTFNDDIDDPTVAYTIKDAQVLNSSQTRLFVKWNTKPDGSGVDYEPGQSIADITSEFEDNFIYLYAVVIDRTAIPVTYKWTTNSGVQTSVVNVLYGDAPTIPTSIGSYSNHTLRGWSKNNATTVRDKATIEANDTITAPTTYTAKYNAEYRLMNISDQSITYNSSIEFNGSTSGTINSAITVSGTSINDSAQVNIGPSLTSTEYIKRKYRLVVPTTGVETLSDGNFTIVPGSSNIGIDTESMFEVSASAITKNPVISYNGSNITVATNTPFSTSVHNTGSTASNITIQITNTPATGYKWTVDGNVVEQSTNITLTPGAHVISQAVIEEEPEPEPEPQNPDGDYIDTMSFSISNYTSTLRSGTFKYYRNPTDTETYNISNVTEGGTSAVLVNNFYVSPNHGIEVTFNDITNYVPKTVDTISGNTVRRSARYDTYDEKWYINPDFVFSNNS